MLHLKLEKKPATPAKKGSNCIHRESQFKQNGNFKLAGMLNLKLKKKPATPAKKGINPFTKEPRVFKSKPASKTMRALAMKKLVEALNCIFRCFAQPRSSDRFTLFSISQQWHQPRRP